MKMIRGTRQGFKDEECVVSIGDESTGSDVIKLQRTIGGTQKIGQTFLTQ